MSRGMWKAVETKAGKTRIVKTERRRGKRGSRKEARGKGKGEKIEEEEENDRGKEDSGEMGNLR